MRQKLTFVMLCALSIACLGWTALRLAAEPIPGGDMATDSTAATVQSQEINDALEKFSKRDVPGALESLKQAVEKDKDLPPAHVMLAQLFARAKMGAGVRASLEQAVLNSPDDPEAYVLMGDAAITERRITEADLLFQTAAKMLANFDRSKKRKDVLQAHVYSGLATVAEARGNWNEAQAQLNAWLALDPQSTAAMNRLARCLFQQNDEEGALAKLKEAAKLNVAALTPEAVMAQFCAQAGNREKADKWVKAALLEASDDLKTQLFAAQWYLETGEFDEAMVHAKEAMKIDPKSLDAMIVRGVIALLQKNYPEAEQYFFAATSQSPGTFPASNNLALALIEQADETKQRRALEYAANNAKQYQQDPKYATEANSTLGLVLYKLNRPDDAEKAFNAAVNTAAAGSGQISPDTAYYIALLSVDRGHKEVAIQYLESALQSTGPFMMRTEAEELLKKLKK